MKFFTVFLLALVVLSAVFGTTEAGWLKKQLKKVVSVLFFPNIKRSFKVKFLQEKGVSRVRDRARENLDVVAGYTGVAAQAGVLPGR